MLRKRKAPWQSEQSSEKRAAVPCERRERSRGTAVSLVAARRTPPGPSADGPVSGLVEEAWILGGVVRAVHDLQARRGQQEDPSGDTLYSAAQREDQAGGEVDDALGIALLQVGEVHDDGNASAEEFADHLGIGETARPDGGDPLADPGSFLSLLIPTLAVVDRNQMR